MRTHARWPILLAICAALGISGCTAKEMPATFPVQGKVLQADGTPLHGGAVQFRSLENPVYTTIGDIDQDGNFTLRTLANNERIDGAPPGKYQATVIPDSNDQSNRSVILATIYTIKEGEKTELILKLDDVTPSP